MQADDKFMPIAPLYVPAGHSTHAARDVAFVASLYVPAGHAVQLDSDEVPSLPEYVPAGQKVQALIAVAPATVE